jgi:hypothetical protein
MRFEPSGMTNDPDIRAAKSIVDYIFRWMGKKFLSTDQQEEIGILSPEVRARLAASYNALEGKPATETAPIEAAPPGRRRSSTTGKTRWSAPGAAAGWCERAVVTRVGTPGLTPVVRSLTV